MPISDKKEPLKGRNEKFSNPSGHRERLKKRYAEGGLGALAGYEFVELLLTYAIPRSDVKPIAKELLSTFGNFRGIIDAELEDLKNVRGMGDSSALFIKSLKDLLSFYHEEELFDTEKTLDTVSKLMKYFRARIGGKSVEILEMVCFDAQLRLIKNGTIKLFEGSVNSANVDIRKIVETAIRRGASSIAIAHNHPSGNPAPSFDDINFTRKLSQACMPIELNLIEHIIVGKKTCFSFRRDGHFDSLYDDSLEEGRIRSRQVAEKRKILSSK